MALCFLRCIDTLNLVLGVFASSAGDKSLVVHSEQLHLWANRTFLPAERMLKSLGSTATLHGTKLPPPPFAAKHFPATGSTRPGSDEANSPTLSL